MSSRPSAMSNRAGASMNQILLRNWRRLNGKFLPNMGKAAAVAVALLLAGCGQRSKTPDVAAQTPPQTHRAALALSEPPASQPEANTFALSPEAKSKLPIYEIRIKPRDLAAMDANPYGKDLYPATFAAEGVVYENVKIRYRGAWARTWPKKPLKVFF